MHKRLILQLGTCVERYPTGFTVGTNIVYYLYINNLVEHCISGSDLYLYADDAKLFSFVTSWEDSVRLENDIDCLTQWMEVWLLRLNIGKCM